ncbi:MAG TPA: hypothetical protein VM554_03725 [Acidisarcina sp.]|nr:hypothetical protein [Acidisarcina sp.]
MSNIPIEYVLALGYAIFLLAAALLLEAASRYAYRRSLQTSTMGFTYHPERNIWKCPENQHLFPVFTDPFKGSVTYRAHAATCNACHCKPSCTDSSSGREIVHKSTPSLKYGMQHFHRGLSLMLLTLANLILIVEMLRTPGFYPRALLLAVLVLFCAIGMRLFSGLPPGTPQPGMPQQHPNHARF